MNAPTVTFFGTFPGDIRGHRPINVDVQLVNILCNILIFKDNISKIVNLAYIFHENHLKGRKINGQKR